MLLLPNTVGPQYILTIQVLPHGVTLYRRPTVRQYMEHLATINCVVPACRREWRMGTQFYLECGEPIAWRAIADIAQQLPAKIDGSVEVKRRYGLAMSQYASSTDQPDAGLGQPPGPSTGPRASPTPVVANQPCVAPASSAAATTPTPGLGFGCYRGGPKTQSCSRTNERRLRGQATTLGTGKQVAESYGSLPQ